jgi:hypothetical protein
VILYDAYENGIRFCLYRQRRFDVLLRVLEFASVVVRVIRNGHTVLFSASVREVHALIVLRYRLHPFGLASGPRSLPRKLPVSHD